MKNILVIGGSGFLGRNIVDKLNSYNYKVYIYDIKKIEDYPNCYIGDIINDEMYDERFKNIDMVIYLVSAVSPKKSMEIPEETYKKDIPLLIKTLESCKKNKIKRVVFASSGGTIYGDIGNKLSVETEQNFPINNYGISKLTSEKILQMYNKLYNMENISLRISNPYGKNQYSSSGVGVITTFADSIKNDNVIKIYGDGTITRDFINVDDVAEAFYLALCYKFNKRVKPVFNIGSGSGMTINEIINILEEVLNKKAKTEYLELREFDVKYSVLNIEKAKQHLKYNPKNNEVEMIKKYIKERYLDE